MPDITMRIILNAQDNASATFKNMGQYMSAVQPVAVAAGAALMAVGAGLAYSVKSASDFQSSLLKVQAYAGMTAQATADMGQKILALAPQLGEAPKALADSLYSVASAGFKGADGLKILKEAGMTAAASNSDATVTTFSLVSSLNALGLGASQAGNISDELNATVKNGLMTWDQYGSVVGKIAGTVASAGGSATMLQSNFTALNASLDVYTNAGISAHQASMWLNSDMSLLFGKAGTLATNAAKLGLSFDASKYATMDFAQRLQYLNQVTGSNQQALVKLVGGNSQVANSVAFLNNHYTSLQGTIKSISGSMQNGATTQAMFATAQQGAAFKAAQMQAALQVLAITVGEKLLPAVSQILGAVTPLISRFASWASTLQADSPVLAALGGILAGLAAIVMAAVVPSLIAAASGFLAVSVAGAPLWAIILGIMAAVAAIVLVIQHWNTVMAALNGVIHTVGSALGSVGPLFSFLGPMFQQIGSIVASAFIPVWQQLVQQWNGQLLPALREIWAALQPAMPLFQAIGAMILTVVVIAFGVLIGVLTGVAKAFAGLLAGIATVMTGIVQIISGAITIVAGILALLTDLFTGNFTNLGNDLRNIWTGIATMFTGIWHVIAGIFQAAWGVISGLVSGFIQGIIAYFTSLYNTLVGHSIVPDMINGIVSWFTQLPGRALAAVQSLLSGMTGFFGNLATQAVTWGKNLISGFVSGITGMASAAASAAQNIISTVAGYLGFHSPAAMGEGQHIIEWGQNAVKAFAQGMTSMQPMLQTQMNAMIHAPTGGGGTTNNISRGPTTFHINVNMNNGGNMNGNQMAVALADQLRAQFGNI